MKKILLGESIVSQFMQVIPITIIIAVFYAIFRIKYLKNKHKEINYQKEALYLIFICYIVGLFNLVLVPSNFWIITWNNIFYGYGENPFVGMFDFSYSFVPTLYRVIKGELIIGSWVKTMLIGNILMFIPMGIFLALCLKKINNKNIFLYAILITIIIEFTQLIVGRSCDIDDLIMNSLGIIIGYFISNLILKIKKKKI